MIGYTTQRPAATDRQRWLVALLMPIGPAAVALLRFILPYNTTDSAASVVRKVAAHSGAQHAVLWLEVVAIFTLVPGAYAALRLSRGAAPRLTAAAAGLLIPGYLALAAGGAGGADTLTYVGVTHGVDHGTLARLVDLTGQSGPSVVLGIVFVVGHIVGTVLLAIALWRSGVIPPWAAAVLGVSQPLHLIAAMSGNHPLDLLGWGLTAVGMASAAAAVLGARREIHHGDGVASAS